ncbi:AraC family transcriptional regulator [Actomonas aquatica]|uniref:AraC family transcriptional regulator n=1 Tax=Actomonas aquatica TaxID=2866162 RepID=A0ABZ1C5Q0_9BACT|nr:AraC family transcriptional regulator [Opitutus sp. WL0086]WRQ86980.1 AraC family transcriptional regulator [Opitutus sp. WL0086]
MSHADVDQPPYISHQVQAAKRFYLGTAVGSTSELHASCGGWERTAADYTIRRDTFPWLGIEFVAGGRGTLWFGRRSYPLSRGCLFSYGPGVAHRIESDSRALLSKYYINFGGQQAANLMSAAQMDPGSFRVVDNSEEIESALDLLIAEGGRSRPQAPQIASLQLHILLLKLGQGGANDPRSDRRAQQTLRKCLDYIDRHFLAVATAEQIAAACHVSPSHMTRLFGRFGYVSPYDYLVRKKMVHAAELFDSGYLLVREVAERFGMDSFQFSRVFKRVHGLSPSQFLRRHGR